MGLYSANQTQREAAAIGGIVAVYYGTTLIGGMISGWMGDKIGRVKTIELACIVALIGAAFQASAQNIGWMMAGRMVTGLGTGALKYV